MQQTIKTVSDRVRDWDSQHGPMCSIEGTFEDGSAFQNNCKPENVERRLESLKELIGQPRDFDLAPKADYKGQKQWTMKKLPEAPQEQPLIQGQQGGGQQPARGGYQVRFRDTEEGFLREQRSIHRSVALQHAVAWLGAALGKGASFTDEEVIKTAGTFFQWLSQDAQQPLSNVQEAMRQAPPLGPNQAPAASNHPSLDELKDRFSLQTGADVLKGREKFSQMILEAVKNKNLLSVAQGGSIGTAIREASNKQELTRDDEEFLYQEILAARRVLSVGP